MHRYNYVRQRFNPETFLRLASVKFVGSSILLPLLLRVCVCTCVCTRVCVCVCHTEKKVPDECMASTTSETGDFSSSNKHNAKKMTTRVRGPFHQSITAILTEEKRENRSFLNLQMLQSTCFGTEIETGVDSGDDSGSACVCVCVCVCVYV